MQNEETGLIDLIKGDPSQSAEALWEDYEEWFADDPFNAALIEIRRVITHAKALSHQLSGQQKLTLALIEQGVDQLS